MGLWYNNKEKGTDIWLRILKREDEKMIRTEKAIEKLLQLDPGLAPFAGEFRLHLNRYNQRRNCERGEILRHTDHLKP